MGIPLFRFVSNLRLKVFAFGICTIRAVLTAQPLETRQFAAKMGLEKLGWTYIRPSRKTPETAIFCFFDIWRTQIIGNGIINIVMSMKTLMIPEIWAP